MKYSTPKVTLLTHTRLPLETVYSVWQASKNEDALMTPEEVLEKVEPSQVEKLFKAVIAQKIPVGEHVDFVFMLENVSVSWREQAVRHRIGAKVGDDRIGVDIIPELAESSFWSQSMRIQHMGNFAANGKYRVPETIKAAGPHIRQLFHKAMREIEYAYNYLVDYGIPMEDARELIPLGAQHRISWRLNIGALQHIVGKRGCWILQLGIWGPIIMGMIEELAQKVHPIFRDLVKPPCIGDDDEFKACIYMEECRRRIDENDQLPPCPLHFFKHEIGVDPIDESAAIDKANEAKLFMRVDMFARAQAYMKFWGRNPYTGKKSN
jgi:thymidylate synthase ThyX